MFTLVGDMRKTYKNTRRKEEQEEEKIHQEDPQVTPRDWRGEELGPQQQILPLGKAP